ncbi:dihydroorotate dehydrogenase B (NAD(+)), catalytic subunit [Desulfosarcina alkanivorans]|jgi:dihydroorotate dehydrogenase (NAD+) catalytic subunit|uniref:Dihydroorotate dehydrogenase n=1 Tax=Desulfosarcina alkanivorans TaxID=571177 RepID=A0A5K7YDC3_9BACT|nr:dihydroorotate dehydrogenase [Desulfosarcina alkanivorans]BBO67482.1 dihydroorotate dehydrogenase B (NAD(+)), catalytic subunit [Desulfosarcina alkanivorans]
MISPDLTVDIGGLTLQNPVMTASGTFGYAREFDHYIDLNRLGGIIVKGLSLEPSKGNPPPRIVETDCGMLNAIGLENVGIDAFIREKLPFLETLCPPTIANIYGKTVAEYARLAERMEPLDAVKGLEVNISCPNVKEGGVAFGSDPALAREVVSAVREKTTKHLMVKLSPNVTDIALMAEVAEAAGADALSLINTITGMAVDLSSRRSRLANVTGGLSGPAIKPVALRMVWQASRAVSIPVVGVGGIMNATDALEFMMVGATAVQVGTANFVNPGGTMDIIDGMQKWLRDEGLDDVKQLIGTLVTDG